MAKIFISYSSDSQAIVEELVRDLNDDGHETWFDKRLTGAGGQKWWNKILLEIEACDIFVAALTPDSLESHACQRELNYAGQLQRALLPVRLSDKVQPEVLPHRLAELQWVDYHCQDKQAFKKLQQTIRGLPDTPPLPDPLPDPPPVPLSYLGTLREQIDTDSQLTAKDQSHLVFELRSQFQDGGRAEEIIDLLQRLKKRRELLANVQRGIDELLGEINRSQPGSPSSEEHEPLDGPTSPPSVPSSGLKTFRDQIGKKSPLAVNEQFQLVFELRGCFRNGAPAEQITDLLQRLKKRDDVAAKVAREIDKVQAEVNPGAREDPVPNLGREIELVSAAGECRSLMERVLNKGECWEFEIDPKNRFVVKMDASAATQCIMATASLVNTIGGAKTAELKKLGWTVYAGTLIKVALAGTALYLTSGLAAAALLSRGVRDTLNELEASRSWTVTDPKDAVIDAAAADLISALRAVAPEAKPIIVRRQEIEPQA